MKNSTLVDSNILIDVLGPSSAQGELSGDALINAATHSRLFINQIVWAEVAGVSRGAKLLESALQQLGIAFDDLPWSAAYSAGQSHVAYRRRGGNRTRTLPDFFVGAHAKAVESNLITRDPRRYRQYFPDVPLITPDMASA